MTQARMASVVVAGVLALGSFGRAQTPPAGQGGRFPLPDQPRIFETAQQRVRVSVVARGISRPFSLLMLPNGDMLVSQRGTGKLLAIRGGKLDPNPVAGVPDVHIGFHAGLLDFTLHPKFAENRLIYFTYHKQLAVPAEYAITLARGRYDGTSLSNVEELYVGTMATVSGGSRLGFGPDGLIYVTTSGATRDNKAQELDNSYGKVLRFLEDGSIPPDNPYVGRTGHRPEVFSYGHRDHYGITFHPTTGQVMNVELGPLGGDKVNIILPGRNYGWPLYSYGRDNDSSPLPHPNRDGIEPALITWQPGIAPQGVTFYTGDRFPAWKDNLLVASIQRGRIPGTGGVERVVFNERLWELRRETMFQDLKQRVRDVRQGADGLIYFLTDEEDGAVFKVEPAN